MLHSYKKCYLGEDVFTYFLSVSAGIVCHSSMVFMVFMDRKAASLYPQRIVLSIQYKKKKKKKTTSVITHTARLQRVNKSGK